MNVKILGTGCPNCVRLEALVKEVAREKGLSLEVDKVTSSRPCPMALCRRPASWSRAR